MLLLIIKETFTFTFDTFELQPSDMCILPRVFVVSMKKTLRPWLSNMRPVKILGPIVQSVVSLTSSLRVISLTVLADSIYNILIFLLKKM